MSRAIQLRLPGAPVSDPQPPVVCEEGLVLQRVEQGEEDRHLQDQGETRTHGVDLVLLVELHHLLIEDFSIALVLLLERLDLGLQLLHAPHALELTVGQRDEHDTDQDREKHYGPAPVVGEAIEELEDGVKYTGERIEKSAVIVDRPRAYGPLSEDLLLRTGRERKTRC